VRVACPEAWSLVTGAGLPQAARKKKAAVSGGFGTRSEMFKSQTPSENSMSQFIGNMN